MAMSDDNRPVMRVTISGADDDEPTGSRGASSPKPSSSGRQEPPKKKKGGAGMILGCLAVVLLLGVLGVAGMFLLASGKIEGGPGDETATAKETAGQAAANTPPKPVTTATATAPQQGGETAPAPQWHGDSVELGIAYGTEKKRWLKWAVEEFARTPAGRKVRIKLIPMGSQEGARAILAGDDRIHVWSPAGSVYKNIFLQEWNLQHNRSPILREENLALTPMVFVFWEQRYEAFVAKYKEVSFATVAKALEETGGWNSIANKPEWGLFKFGHTHPNQSNSGLMALLLMTYDYHQKYKGLSVRDVVDVAFQKWLQNTEQAVTGLSNSTGNMMKEMVLKGPSSYDVLFVYESVAIDYLKNAEGRWDRLRIVYPDRNIWNDNPYYIIGSPWSTPSHRQAAELFLDFLLTPQIQAGALRHGFRPGNPSVPVKDPGSPFVKYAEYGLKVDLASACEPPAAEVVHNLLVSWQRSQGRR